MCRLTPTPVVSCPQEKSAELLVPMSLSQTHPSREKPGGLCQFVLHMEGISKVGNRCLPQHLLPTLPVPVSLLPHSALGPTSATLVRVSGLGSTKAQDQRPNGLLHLQSGSVCWCATLPCTSCVTLYKLLNLSPSTSISFSVNGVVIVPTS